MPCLYIVFIHIVLQGKKHRSIYVDYINIMDFTGVEFYCNGKSWVETFQTFFCIKDKFRDCEVEQSWKKVEPEVSVHTFFHIRNCRNIGFKPNYHDHTTANANYYPGQPGFLTPKCLCSRP